MKRFFSTKNLSGIGVLSALSFVFYLIEIPLFPAVPFLKLDFSNLFVMLGGFMYGPVGAIIILVIKEALHLTISTSLYIGEMANVIVGLSYALVPSIIYLYRKGIKSVILTLILGLLLANGVALLTNKFINFPLYDRLFSIYDAGLTFESVVWWILLFNFIKYLLLSVLTFLLYKKLSFLFKKINLKEQGVKISHSNLDTIKIAYDYAKTLKKGDVVILSGDLGAGKTEFVKGVAKRFNLSGVVSPTYAYLNVYGDFIYHYDCYRLSSGEDAEVLGLTDYFNKDNICLIEWAENIKSVLPSKVKRVIINKIGENEREIIL